LRAHNWHRVPTFAEIDGNVATYLKGAGAAPGKTDNQPPQNEDSDDALPAPASRSLSSMVAGMGTEPIPKKPRGGSKKESAAKHETDMNNARAALHLEAPSEPSGPSVKPEQQQRRAKRQQSATMDISDDEDTGAKGKTCVVPMKVAAGKVDLATIDVDSAQWGVLLGHQTAPVQFSAVFNTNATVLSVVFCDVACMHAFRWNKLCLPWKKTAPTGCCATVLCQLPKLQGLCSMRAKMYQSLRCRLN